MKKFILHGISGPQREKLVDAKFLLILTLFVWVIIFTIARVLILTNINAALRQLHFPITNTMHFRVGLMHCKKYDDFNKLNIKQIYIRAQLV